MKSLLERRDLTILCDPWVTKTKFLPCGAGLGTARLSV
jgi:hypothetical protein